MSFRMQAISPRPAGRVPPWHPAKRHLLYWQRLIAEIRPPFSAEPGNSHHGTRPRRPCSPRRSRPRRRRASPVNEFAGNRSPLHVPLALVGNPRQLVWRVDQFGGHQDGAIRPFSSSCRTGRQGTPTPREFRLSTGHCPRSWHHGPVYRRHPGTPRPVSWTPWTHFLSFSRG